MLASWEKPCWKELSEPTYCNLLLLISKMSEVTDPMYTTHISYTYESHLTSLSL